MSDEPHDLKAMLRNWIKLNTEIMLLSEEELTELLQMEQAGRARLRIMLRIYNRYSKVRSIREKSELAVGARG